MDILYFTKKVENQLDLDVEWLFSQILLQCQGDMEGTSVKYVL